MLASVRVPEYPGCPLNPFGPVAPMNVVML